MFHSTPTPMPMPSRIAVILGTSPRPPTSGPASPSQYDEPPSLVTSDIYPPRLERRASVPGNLHTPSHRTSDRAAQHATPAGSRPQPPATEPPKRRGRPVGWRPGMGPYSAKASFPGGASAPRPKKPATTAKGGLPKRRGRKPGSGARQPREIYERSRPKFLPFLCEWEDCPAELQNLETLRKHVLVVHGRSETCRWGKCARATRPRSLPSRDAFQRHAEDVHLVPFAWHVGDGPQNTSSEAEVARSKETSDRLPKYLFGEGGSQVTPSILHQELENEDERKVRRRRLHRLLLERDRNAPEEEPPSPVDELTSRFKKV